MRALIFCSSDRPDSPGMRMSETSTCGGGAPASSVASASAAEPKLLKGISSRASAFSKTQRMERSSSMIQTDSLCFLWGVRGSITVKQVRPGTAVDFDAALVLLDEVLRQREPSPLPPGRPDTKG
jgi:hypothetical protein